MRRLVEQLGARGTRTAVVVSAGLEQLGESGGTHLTPIDCEREMAFVAVTIQRDRAPEEILAVAHACSDPDNVSAEFA